MIEGHIILPKDVFVQICVEHQKLSDKLLSSAKAVIADNVQLSEPTLDHLLAAQVLHTDIVAMLKIVAEENFPKKNPDGASSPPENGDNGYAQ